MGWKNGMRTSLTFNEGAMLCKPATSKKIQNEFIYLFFLPTFKSQLYSTQKNVFWKSSLENWSLKSNYHNWWEEIWISFFI